MSDAVTIASLELENVKRVRAVSLSPAPEGLTVIGGRNRQGKTSVLDAIAWALGGDRFRPDKPNRDGAMTPARLRVELSNGLVVERKGKNGSLTVTDPDGRRAGQQLVNGFVETLALDLPRFMGGTDRERADALLRVIGVGDELARLDSQIRSKYEERHSVGQMATRKRKAAEDMPSYPEAPLEPVSVAELVMEQQAILARNGENQRKRARADELTRAARDARRALETQSARISELERQLEAAREEFDRMLEGAREAEADAATAAKTAEQLEDESTEEVEASIAAIEATNEMVRTNMARAAAEAEAEALEGEYRSLDAEVQRLRDERVALLEGADLPLPGLSVQDGLLYYRGAAWGDMSGADQLRVATAIVRRVKPECGFVLVDKLEQMDAGTLSDFAAWCREEGLQVIGTRVGADDTCTVVIEDGYVTGATHSPATEAVGWDGSPDYGEEF